MTFQRRGCWGRSGVTAAKRIRTLTDSGIPLYCLALCGNLLPLLFFKEVPMRMRVCTWMFLCLASAVPAAAQTQITTGVIQGVVSDPSGGVLPGVTVEARN